MILNNAPINSAVMSNVGVVGEFNIRNSAKAFGILSSGLYSNKIRAIIRELACNASDSHVAAGCASKPWDLHLPTILEPWFAVRDYGTGLSDAEVMEIYTTYFASTKDQSNEFIGALGLGSKSPFAYTDNFTVTAVKNGERGIYTAFINDQGVPSIVSMQQGSADQAPNGVEVKFSVTNSGDFSRFSSEAEYVFRYFDNMPVCNLSSAEFAPSPPVYEITNLLPGVHVRKSDTGSASHRGSVAIMGKIAYPITVPKSDTSLGNLSTLLSYQLDLHFDIGELEFQPSREGLGYVPRTMQSIGKKLKLISEHLLDHIAQHANKIDNMWERAEWLQQKFISGGGLYQQAVRDYVSSAALPTLSVLPVWNSRLDYHKFLLSPAKLAINFNIKIRSFSRTRGSPSCKTNEIDVDWDRTNPAPPGGYPRISQWKITTSPDAYFVKNDTRIGASERAKYHFRQMTKLDYYSITVYVLEKYDTAREMDTDGFFKLILSPTRVLLASQLSKPVTRKSKVSESIPLLEAMTNSRRSQVRSSHNKYNDDWGWGKSNTLSTAESGTYYYLPLSGFQIETIVPAQMQDITTIMHMLRNSGIPILRNITVYGVRKTDIEQVRTQKNWINLEQLLTQLAHAFTHAELQGVAASMLDRQMTRWLSVAPLITDLSPLTHLIRNFDGNLTSKYNYSCIMQLMSMYAPEITVTPKSLYEAAGTYAEQICSKYPLLDPLNGHAPDQAVADYINAIDSTKKD